MAGFEDLEVWQRAVELSASVYRAMNHSHDFAFRDQICRSALSIPSNISEGMERPTPPDQIRFLDYARSSAGEFRTQAIVGQKAGFLPPATADLWIEESRQLSAMIQGLIRSITRKA